jgi:hypothetical protein
MDSLGVTEQVRTCRCMHNIRTYFCMCVRRYRRMHIDIHMYTCIHTCICVGKHANCMCVGKSTLMRALAGYRLEGLQHLRILLVDQHVEGDDDSPLQWLLRADVERTALLEEVFLSCHVISFHFILFHYNTIQYNTIQYITLHYIHDTSSCWARSV